MRIWRKKQHIPTHYWNYHYILTDKSLPSAPSVSSSLTVILSQLLSRLTTLQSSYKIWPQGGHGSTESLFLLLIPYEHHLCHPRVQLAYAGGVDQWTYQKSLHIFRGSYTFANIVTMVGKKLTHWNLSVAYYIFQSSHQIDFLTNGPMNFETKGSKQKTENFAVSVKMSVLSNCASRT